MLLLAACSGRVDFVIDATALAAGRPDGELLVDLVQQGRLVERRTVDLDVSPVVTLPDALEAPSVYGVTAWIDLDGDARCNAEEDLAWSFEYYSGVGEDFVWAVSPTDLLDSAACWWFDGVPGELPEQPGDTDEEDGT